MSNIQTTNHNEEEDEDDWETAEITIPTKGKLRPTAPTFQPAPAPQASGSRHEQRVHAPPGGSWNVNKRPQRSDWEVKKAANGYTNTNTDGGGDGDDWFGEGRGVSNRQLWDEANSNQPPPQITFSQNQQLPTPQIKILRRQTPSNSTSENITQTAQGKTYAEKEEEYRLARERIFGGNAIPVELGGEKSGRGSGSTSTSPGGGGCGGGGRTPVSRGRTPDSSRSTGGNGAGNGNGVVRQPRGPGEGGGFGVGGGGGGVGGGQQFPPGW